MCAAELSSSIMDYLLQFIEQVLTEFFMYIGERNHMLYLFCIKLFLMAVNFFILVMVLFGTLGSQSSSFTRALHNNFCIRADANYLNVLS
jgi:uncharacterized phage infection (PIP) family protein YhgE